MRNPSPSANGHCNPSPCSGPWECRSAALAQPDRGRIGTSYGSRRWRLIISSGLRGALSETRVFGMRRHPSDNLSLVVAVSLTLSALAGAAQAQSRSIGSPSAATRPATSGPIQLLPTPQAPPQPAPSTAAPPPPSALGTPAPQIPGIAPLSPQQSPSTPSGGGLAKQSTLALSAWQPE